MLPGVSTVLFFTVYQHSAFDRFQSFQVEHDDREPLIGHENAMRSHGLLAVVSPLHRAEDILEVTADLPDIWPHIAREPHFFQNCKSFGCMLLSKSRGVGRAGGYDHLEIGALIVRSIPCAADITVERCISLLSHFSCCGYGGVMLGPVPELPCT